MDNNLFNVTYKKNLARNYMVLTPSSSDDSQLYEDQLKHNFRAQMVKENNIDGMLQTHIQFTDGIPEFYYDISGLQSLKIMLDSTPLSHELLSKIFLGLHNVLLSIEKYMLLYEHLLTDIDYIFVSSDYSKIYFCYYPLLTQDFALCTRKFFDALLMSVDHTDEKSVYLAYTMHKESLNPDFNTHKLLSVLSSSPNIPLSPTISSHPLKEEPYYNLPTELDTPALHHSIKSASDKDNSRFLLKTVVLGTVTLLVLITITSMFFFKLFDLSFYLVLLAITLVVAGYNGYMIYFLNAPSELSLLVASKINKENVASEAKPQDISSTILLTPVTDDCLYQLIYTGTDQRHHIDLKTFPFIIGSSQTCDSYISSPTVSRIHAKIDLITNDNGDKSLFIEDLNSTNGTLVNEVLLSPYDKTPISPGDHLSFAGITYMLR